MDRNPESMAAAKIIPTIVGISNVVMALVLMLLLSSFPLISFIEQSWDGNGHNYLEYFIKNHILKQSTVWESKPRKYLILYRYCLLTSLFIFLFVLNKLW